MPSNALCPGCHSEIDPSSTSCPVCMRPRSRREIIQSIIAIRQAPARRKRAVARVAVLGIVLAAAGFFGWRARAGLLDRALQAKASITAWMGKSHDVLGLSGSDAPPPAAGPQSPAQPVPDPAAAPDAGRLPPPTPAAAGTPAAVPARNDWSVRGLVYDLFTLKPVAGARVTFTSRESGQVIVARSDAAGRYGLRLPRVSSGGYDVAVRQKRYQQTYLEENEPPYRSMSGERRQEAASQLLQSAVLHVPFLPAPEEETVEHDLVLLPR